MTENEQTSETGPVDPDRADPADEGGPATFLGFDGDGGWVAAIPLPYYEQQRPAWWKRALIFTLFRRYRCQARWSCAWPATEQGGTCDQHAAIGGHAP